MPVSFYEAMSKRPFTAPFSAGEIRRFHDESYGQRSSRFLNPWHYLHGKKRCRVPGVAWPMPDAIATADDLKRFVDGYDASVLHLDSLIGEVLAYFRGRGLMEDTAFIVSADHGDSLGEEGIYGEHGNAAPPTHRIPLIVRWPGRTRGKRAEDALIYGLDLSATLADLAGLKAPAQWDGRSFAALLGKKGKHVERDFLVLSHAVWSAQRACYDGRHWYLRTYHPGTMYLRETSLFDVKSDPFLRNDLSRDKPELCALMESRMEKWVAENRGTRDPLMEEARQGPYSYFSKDDWTGMLRENGLPGDAEKFLKSLEYYETKLLF